MKRVTQAICDKAKVYTLAKVPVKDILRKTGISKITYYNIRNAEFSLEAYRFLRKRDTSFKATFETKDSIAYVIRDCINDTYKMNKRDWENIAFTPRGGAFLINKYVSRINNLNDLEIKSLREEVKSLEEEVKSWKRAALIIFGIYLIVSLISVL